MGLQSDAINFLNPNNSFSYFEIKLKKKTFANYIDFVF